MFDTWYVDTAAVFDTYPVLRREKIIPGNKKTQKLDATCEQRTRDTTFARFRVDMTT